jgi:two-component system sensor histidine kinase YesM
MSILNPLRLIGFFGNVKFQTKLFFSYIILVILFVVIAGFYIYYYSVASIENEVIDFAHISLQQIIKNVDNYINELYRLTSLTYSDEELRVILKRRSSASSAVEQVKYNDYIFNFLFNIYSLRKDLYSIYLITSSGELYSEGLNRYTIASYDITKEEWYEELERKPLEMLVIGPRISTHTMGASNERFVFTVVRKIIDIDNQTLGVIILDADYRSFEDLFAKFEDEQKAQVILLNNKEQIMYNSGQSASESSGWITAMMEQIKSSSEGDRYEKLNVNNQKRLIIQSSSDYTGWKTVMAIPQTQLLKKINAVKSHIIIIGIVCIIASIFLSIIISSAVTGPVKRLIKLMKKAEDGDFSASTTILTNDEIGELGRGFNSMISKINLLLKKMVEVETKKRRRSLKPFKAR